jgi:hypothetical protein
MPVELVETLVVGGMHISSVELVETRCGTGFRQAQPTAPAG